MDLVRAAQAVGAALAQANVLDLAGALQFDHGFHRLLDRRHLVEAVDVVQVNIGETQTLQRLLDGLSAVFWRRVHRQGSDPPFPGLHADGELGGEEDVLALVGVRGEPFANEILAVAVFIG